jgi:hypothetical protein
VTITMAQAKDWWVDMRRVGATYTETDFLEAWRLLHSTRDQTSGAWRLGRRTLCTDPRTLLEQRMAEAATRRENRANGTESDTQRTYRLRQQAQALEEELREHPGRPGSAWPSHVQEANAGGYETLAASLKTIRNQLATAHAPA